MTTLFDDWWPKAPLSLHLARPEDIARYCFNAGLAARAPEAVGGACPYCDDDPSIDEWEEIAEYVCGSCGKHITPRLVGDVWHWDACFDNEGPTIEDQRREALATPATPSPVAPREPVCGPCGGTKLYVGPSAGTTFGPAVTCPYCRPTAPTPSPVGARCLGGYTKHPMTAGAGSVGGECELRDGHEPPCGPVGARETCACPSDDPLKCAMRRGRSGDRCSCGCHAWSVGARETCGRCNGRRLILLERDQVRHWNIPESHFGPCPECTPPVGAPTEAEALRPDEAAAKELKNPPHLGPPYEWTATDGPVDFEEPEHEYNPGGTWLGNTETNQVFILPEDLPKVLRVLTAALPPSAPDGGASPKEKT